MRRDIRRKMDAIFCDFAEYQLRISTFVYYKKTIVFFGMMEYDNENTSMEMME